MRSRTQWSRLIGGALVAAMMTAGCSKEPTVSIEKAPVADTVQAAPAGSSATSAADASAWVPTPANTGEETQFTPSAEHRAKLLAQARQVDADREAAKKTQPTLTLVDEGKPVSTIVATEADMPAAKLLQEWLKLMSGAEVPIAQAVGDGANIYVGEAAVAAGLDLSKIESPSNEGLRVVVDADKVLIAGQSGESTVRAVARFLEEHFGCRWLSNRDWGKVYPNQKTLKALQRDFSDAPTFQYRRLWGAEARFSGAHWLTWAGHGGTQFPMGHSWGGVFEGISFEEKPDWYAMNAEGERFKGHWPNLGNPAVRERFIQAALEASDHGKQHISLSPPDDHREDFSPEAKKYDEPIEIDPSSGRVSMTNRFMGMVNEAAKEIYKHDKHAVVSFYAYSDYTLPPTATDLQKLSPNIAVWIAPIRFSRLHPLGHPKSESTQLLKEIFDGWADKASMMGYRSYNYNLAEVMTPYSKITSWAYDLPYIKSRGGIGNSLESFDCWELSAPHLYQSIQLSYDPTQDPWLLMADYWHKAYGPAAEAMEAYWMEIDQAAVNSPSEAGSYHSLYLIYTPERLALLDGHLKEAESATAGDEANAKRVNLARRGWQRAKYWRQWYDAINAGELQKALATTEEWRALVEESYNRRDENKYGLTYLDRFIIRKTKRAHDGIFPDGRIAAVLPDQWVTSTQEELGDENLQPVAVDYDDSSWKPIHTFTQNRNAQGFPEYFGNMWYRTTFDAPQVSGKQFLQFIKADRKVTVWVNGKQANEEPVESFNGSQIDISGLLKSGEPNQITVCVTHIPLPELFLGGLVEPIYLVEKPAE